MVPVPREAKIAYDEKACGATSPIVFAWNSVQRRAMSSQPSTNERGMYRTTSYDCVGTLFLVAPTYVLYSPMARLNVTVRLASPGWFGSAIQTLPDVGDALYASSAWPTLLPGASSTAISCGWPVTRIASSRRSQFRFWLLVISQ